SPVMLRGWDSGDTTVIELEDYLTKASAVKEVMVQTGWQQQKSSDGKQLLLFRNSTAKSPPYKTLKPEGTEISKEGAAGRVSSVQVLDIQDPALVPLWPLSLVLKNGEVLDIPVKAPLLREALFRYKPGQGEKVESVTVAGDFNGWSEKNHPMAYVADAQEWQLRLKLAAGSYPYQLVVNGKWMLDPAQPKTRDNGLGGINSLLRLMPEGDDAPALDLVQANEDQLQLVWAGHPAGVLVFWENMLIMRVEPGQSPRELVVKVPKEAARQARSFLRIYTYNSKVPGNDLLIPLFKGKVVQNAKDLTRQDAEAQRMYFVFVDRFANGDTTNDQRVDHPEVHPKANYWGGDLQGVMNKLQEGYFDRLGINSLWLSPIVQNPLGPYREWPKPNRMYSGYHGYWPISSSRVDRRFGDEALLRKLIDTAHAHGINVLLDYVANHVHQEHPLLKEHPDWITTLDLPHNLIKR
ncbi:MAG: alpha-amylase family glycosyl hydrolase, partial [Bacteroidota bacterium]